MKVSEQIIQVLDALCDKLGLAIDWTAENVLPYAQSLLVRFVKYEIATSIFYIILAIGMLAVALYLIKLGKHFWKLYKKDTYSDYNLGCGWTIAAAVVLIGIATWILIAQIYDIITCLYLPELKLYQAISSLIECGHLH